MGNKMDKFFMWFDRNRNTIGYTIGGLCLFSAGLDYIIGDTMNAIMFTIMGVVVTFDVWSTR
jgi:hypothetical protein